ncbi:MAG: hypothetical protein IJQ84_06095 [Paludibacteraceae bacterium]|nr:hypothetical protein [Paludibacteraceae bacterium]MBR0065424.1 hypothetical protein [Paludibacteraceae bacterium]
MATTNIVTRIDEVRMRVSEPKQMIGKMLAEAACRSYKEDFVDSDTGEVHTVERKNVIFERGHILSADDVAKIQFHQQAGELEDILVTNQNRPNRLLLVGGMYEVAIKDSKSKSKLLVYAQSVSMATTIAIDYCEQCANGDFYIQSIKVADNMHIVNYERKEDDHIVRSYHTVVIEYWDRMDEKYNDDTFLTLAKDADEAIDIVRSLILNDENKKDFYGGDFTIAAAKQSGITDIVPPDMSKAYSHYAQTHKWLMGGMRVGLDASNL